MRKTFYLLLIPILIIILFPLFLYTGSKYYNMFYHNFWSTQPVSFFHTLKLKDGIISNKKPPKEITNNNYLLEKFSSDDNRMEEITNLLNSNYSNSNNCTYHYDKDYINWMLEDKNEERINLCLSEKSKIIGCITSRPITIFLKGSRLKCLYVDNLCIDQNYRKKGLAPILISHMSNYGYDLGYNLFIYQKEGHQLPYRSITLSENTIYKLKKFNLGDYQLETLNDKNLKQVHDFYNTYLKNKDNYIEYSFTEFSNYFNNKWTTTYIEFINGQIVNLVVIYNNSYQIDQQKVIEIPHLIILNDPDGLFFRKVLNQCFQDGYSLVCNKNKKNRTYFSNLSVTNNFTSFIYMYNYHLVTPLYEHELVFF